MFATRLAELKGELVIQGQRVDAVTLQAVECFFDLDGTKADAVVQADEQIDRINVEIERKAVLLLAMGQTGEHEIRSVLMIVKINNELERIADCAVNIAETVKHYGELSEETPQTFRVMANSVIGMLRDANRALDELNTQLAEQVLDFDDTVDRFTREITLAAEENVARGVFSAQYAFKLLTVTKNLERMADHCTNLCEQVIYLESGLIVRHEPEGWTKPRPPAI